VWKRLLVVTTLIVAAAFFAQGQTKQGGKRQSLEQELMQMQRAEDEAESKKDLAAMERLLADDFIFTAPNGAVSDKKKLIDDVKNDDEAEAGQTIGYDDVKARTYGKTAVVNYLLSVKGKDKDGKDVTNRYRNTVVWVKQQGRWRMAAIHVSRVRT
jgi:ketosteroid isomerase-like protein